MKKINPKTETLIEDESFKIKQAKGNGILRRQIWQDNTGKITRYHLAYINHHLCLKDNGRVLGYDNAHGYHHRHFMGMIEPIHFKSFIEIEEKFQKEIEAMYEKFNKK